MRQMKLTNKQIQEILVDMRQQLKNFKTTKDTLNINFKMPEHTRNKAKLTILPAAWDKIRALVDECDKEIAWHGIVTKVNNEYTISDILVFPQTVTGCTVTSDDTEYSLWLANQPDEIFNSLRFHGHSHVNMGVTPSGVDTSYQEDILRNLKDFYIFAIFNKKGDYWCAIYDIEKNIAYDNKDIELITPNTGAIEWAKEMIKTKVKLTSNVSTTKPKATTKKSKKSIVEEIMDDEDDDYVYGYPYNPYYGGYYGQK